MRAGASVTIATARGKESPASAAQRQAASTMAPGT
jgi:hypothetical protein